LKVDVPSGIESGQRIRIAGAGHAGEPGAPSGDLYVEVSVAERENMIRDGKDLITVVPVDATKAISGDTIEVETLDGEDEIEIPAGTQPGAETTLKGKGLPQLGTSKRRGNHRFVFNVVIPANLSEEQLKLVDDLDGTLTEENRRPKESGLFGRFRRSRDPARGALPAGPGGNRPGGADRPRAWRGRRDHHCGVRGVRDLRRRR